MLEYFNLLNKLKDTSNETNLQNIVKYLGYSRIEY